MRQTEYESLWVIGAASPQTGRAEPTKRSRREQERLDQLMSSLSGLTKSAGSAESKAFEATMLSAADETSQTSCGDFDEITGELMTAWRPAEAADEIGRLGGYRVLKALGVGGVFLAEDVQPNGD